MGNKTFSQCTLSAQFIIASFPIFLVSALFIGFWVSTKIESGIATRQGGVTALYVESFIANHLQSTAGGGELTDHDKKALQSLLSATPLGNKIVSFKVWDRKGTILYSQNPEMIGKSYPIEKSLARAYAGNIHSEVSNLSHDENETENRTWDRLIETYVPIRETGSGKVITVAEFYQTTEELERESRNALLHSWAIVAGVFLTIYLALQQLVGRGSSIIKRQHQELEQQIGQLTMLNQQNQGLHEKMRRAGARTTALNEYFLRRISSDLHDGPGQDLGFALMQVKTISEHCPTCPGLLKNLPSDGCLIQAINRSIQSALEELRNISSGLVLPNIIQLPVLEVVERAINDYETKSGIKVSLHAPVPDPTDSAEVGLEASLPVKITLYRVLQESLANGFRHAGGQNQSVQLCLEGDHLKISISDAGKGFSLSDMKGDKHLGLQGMRERVEILGGSFRICSSAAGTVILANLPLTVPGHEHE